MPNIDLDDPDSGPIAWNEHQRRTVEVTDDEMLRLARKAFPDTDWELLPLGLRRFRIIGAVTMRLKTMYVAGDDDSKRKQELGKRAAHAALKVLAGEE